MQDFPSEEKTQPQGPFALHLARIEQKIDLVVARDNRALSEAFAAHELARTALWARTTWAPFAVSAAAFAISLTVAGYVLAHVMH